MTHGGGFDKPTPLDSGEGYTIHMTSKPQYMDTNELQWDEYRLLAFRTNADLDDSLQNDLHMLSGMLTEMGELADVFKKELAYGVEPDWQNVKEEVGDVFWYLAGYSVFNTKVNETIKMVVDNYYIGYGNRNVSDLELVIMATIRMAKFMEFSLSYDMDNSEKIMLQTFLHILFDFCHRHNFNIYRIMANNIEKLQARYPDKFNSEDAMNRDLDKEREVLDE